MLRVREKFPQTQYAPDGAEDQPVTKAAPDSASSSRLLEALARVPMPLVRMY
jgi:hypothetical protein